MCNYNINIIPFIKYILFLTDEQYDLEIIYMSDTVNRLVKAINIWLTTGDLDKNILHHDFTFSSPFWKNANKEAFLSQFLDATEYKKTALEKIVKFHPIVHCVSEDQQYFTITLTYHTHNGHSVDEVVLAEIKDNLLYRMKSIYDLHETKVALEIK